jgi:hypothetical protein
MFLNFLNRAEQECFLELAYSTANSDNEYVAEEKQMIEYFRNEMQLFESEYKLQNKSLDYIIKELKGSSSIIQNYIMFELLGIIYADKKLVPEEENIVQKLQEVFNFSDEKVKKMHDKVKQIMIVYSGINEVFSED